ncbi:unnamed protein product, partial [Mycena citricolor]
SSRRCFSSWSCAFPWASRRYRGLGLAGGLHVAVELDRVQLGVPQDRTCEDRSLGTPVYRLNQGIRLALDFGIQRCVGAQRDQCIAGGVLEVPARVSFCSRALPLP